MSQLPAGYTVLETFGKFRIVQFPPPGVGGFEFYVVNEKGFLWEPADDIVGALAYLDSDEARAYQGLG